MGWLLCLVSGAHAGHADLRITEIMYNPADPTNGPYSGGDFEFLEIKNIGLTSVDLAGVELTKGVDFVFPALSLGTGACCVVVLDLAAFATRYDTNGMLIAGTWLSGDKLNNDGEDIELEDPVGATIQWFTYTNTWYPQTDGDGYSLVPVDPYALGDPGSQSYWRVCANLHGSPGADDPQPADAPILVNEVLTHTDWPDVDAIELYNPTATNVDLSGWWLTDDPADPQEHPIPGGTVITAGSYTVFFEDNDGNSSNNASLPPEYFGRNFSCSSHGEAAYLFSPSLTYSNGFTFGASQNGVSFGRHITSDGKTNYPAQSSTSLGTANAGPRPGPVVFTELLYDPIVDDHQFLELMNVSASAVSLYDQDHPSNTWQIAGLGFSFPEGVDLAVSGRVVLVRDTIGTNEFRSLKGIPGSVPVFSFGSDLSAPTGTVSLAWPDSPDGPIVPHIVMDEVDFGTAPPWPAAANGTGRGLQRLAAAGYGNEPTNWTASVYGGSAGVTAPVDADDDGLPDVWESANGLSPASPGDATLNYDSDQLTNFLEYVYGTSPTNADTDADLQDDDDELIAGTSPTNPADTFEITDVSVPGGAPVLSWRSVSGRLYAVQTVTNLMAIWTNVPEPAYTNLPGTDDVLSYTNLDGQPVRFYRLRVRRGE